jgi:paraquat-inducible protein B
MAKTVNTTLIGAFVMAAVILSAAVVVVFGGGKWFQPISRYVVFFPESVQGLSVGAPVQFRGVKIGTVVNIQALFLEEEKKIVIPVYIEVDRARIKNLVHAKLSVSQQQENLLKVGLRAQLAMESLVTGQRSVSIQIDPDAPLRLVGLDKTLPEIPSIPSSIEKLSSEVESLPIGEIASKLDRTLSEIEKVISMPEFAAGVKSFGATSVELEALVKQFSTDLPPLYKSINAKVEGFDSVAISKSLETTLAELRKTVSDINQLSDPLGRNTNKALGEITAAARELRQFAELLQRHPEALLAGKK